MGIVTVVLLALSILSTIFIPPQNMWVVMGFTILLSCLVFTTVRLLTKRRKHAVLASIFVLFALSASYVGGFQPLNILLLASFIIGLGILLK